MVEQDAVQRYPEIEKLARVQSNRELLLEFRDWLMERGIELCTVNTYETGYEEYILEGWGGQRLIMQYLGIDEGRLEEERGAMLAAHREASSVEAARHG